MLYAVMQEVFTVSVGNLPPGAKVLIKITYVSELAVAGENIVFRLPASVAPWKQQSALDEQTQVIKLSGAPGSNTLGFSQYVLLVYELLDNYQDTVDTVKVKSPQQNVSVQVALEMPFDIRSIVCPSHKVKIKVRICVNGEKHL